METETIRLSPERFLHLRALCNAFEVADERRATSASIIIGGVGSIQWVQGGHVEIHIEQIPEEKEV